MKRHAWLLGALVVLTAAAAWSRPLTAPLTEEVHLEALTWVEVRALIQSGKTVAIVPTGGVEQNGPHLVLGKHNYIVRHTAGRIALALGNALVRIHPNRPAAAAGEPCEILPLADWRGAGRP